MARRGGLREAVARALEDVTDDEATALDRWMDDHMHGHAVSNSSSSNWTCDTGCRTQALQLGVSRMLRDRRLAQGVLDFEEAGA